MRSCLVSGLTVHEGASGLACPVAWQLPQALKPDGSRVARQVIQRAESVWAAKPQQLRQRVRLVPGSFFDPGKLLAKAFDHPLPAAAVRARRRLQLAALMEGLQG